MGGIVKKKVFLFVSYFLLSEQGMTVTTLSMFTTRFEQFCVHASIFLLLESRDDKPLTRPGWRASNVNHLAHTTNTTTLTLNGVSFKTVTAS